MDEETKLMIQVCLLEGLVSYLKICYESGETPNEEITKYFNERVKELNGN